MPFHYAELRQKLVAHLIALEAMDSTYAKWALDQARREPSGLYRDLLQDVRAEQERRALLADTSASKDVASTTPTSTS